MNSLIKEMIELHENNNQIMVSFSDNSNADEYLTESIFDILEDVECLFKNEFDENIIADGKKVKILIFDMFIKSLNKCKENINKHNNYINLDEIIELINSTVKKVELFKEYIN